MSYNVSRVVDTDEWQLIKNDSSIYCEWMLVQTIKIMQIPFLGSYNAHFFNLFRLVCIIFHIKCFTLKYETAVFYSEELHNMILRSKQWDTWIPFKINVMMMSHVVLSYLIVFHIFQFSPEQMCQEEMIQSKKIYWVNNNHEIYSQVIKEICKLITNRYVFLISFHQIKFVHQFKLFL